MNAEFLFKLYKLKLKEIESKGENISKISATLSNINSNLLLKDPTVALNNNIFCRKLFHLSIMRIYYPLLETGGCGIIKFEFNLIFLIRSFFQHGQKVKTKF